MQSNIEMDSKSGLKDRDTDEAIKQFSNPIRYKGKKVLILGSGGLRIGQAGEFDYSGSQTIKALKEEGISTVLVNPNIATIQTDPDMADEVYFQPLNEHSLLKIIEKERPDGIFLSFGGQTSLNFGLLLEEKNVFSDYNIQVLGTSHHSIRITEDRDHFKENLDSIGVHTPKSFAASSLKEAMDASQKIGYPIMLRSAFSLGGLGSGKIDNEKDLILLAQQALHASPQLLIEEYLLGWKEIEYEVVRDSFDQALTICNMENFDPMGIHTGESIVVSPSQTLNNEEYHSLRMICLKLARHFQIQGECNVQFAFHPGTGDYRVIEMNARLSRSSALASKATGYPLAFVAAKLALGYGLHEISNAITKKTSAFFEPSLDYIVVKIPRWDIQKLKSASRRIGTKMKSVGEVMAIGRSFPEALQKAVRMLNIGEDGVEDIEEKPKEIQIATDQRLFALYSFFKERGTIEKAHQLSLIDPWFLSQIQRISLFEKELQQNPLTKGRLLDAKKLGFSDPSIAKIKQKTSKEIRSLRKEWNITPTIRQIDTFAGEFEAQTNYVYCTYLDQQHGLAPSQGNATIVLGSGPYSIGSSVEFDWCAVNTARTLRKHGKYTIMINSNPETVSTDFDESDRLYFKELTLERVLDIAEFEKEEGIIVSVGGQIANNLALPLEKQGRHLLGTSGESIDQAENRDRFSSLLHELGIDQPAWERVTSLEKAKEFSNKVGYPVLIRPSYVLSGAAMSVATSEEDLEDYLKKAASISLDHTTVIFKFIEKAKELEVDGIAEKGIVRKDPCHLRTYRKCGSSLWRCHFSPSSAKTLFGNHSKSKKNYEENCRSAQNHRTIQPAVHRKRQRTASDRMQCPRIPFFSFCFQSNRT